MMRASTSIRYTRDYLLSVFQVPLVVHFPTESLQYPPFFVGPGQQLVRYTRLLRLAPTFLTLTTYQLYGLLENRGCLIRLVAQYGGLLELHSQLPRGGIRRQAGQDHRGKRSFYA